MSILPVSPDCSIKEPMAARPTWKGYLKISLVNIPIKVFPATDAGATLSFNQLHAECQTRIQQKRWCPSCQREVPNTDIVKGYEFEKGRYVRRQRRGHREGPGRLDARHQPRAVHRRCRDRSDLPRAALLPGAGRPGGEGGVRGDPGRHEGKSGDRQSRALRPRVPGEGPAARAGPDHVHAAPRQRDPQHGRHRRARRHAGEDQAGRGAAGAAGDRHLRRRRRLRSRIATTTRSACARSSTRRSRAARSSRRKWKRRRRW